jgi:hypothetical protein
MSKVGKKSFVFDKPEVDRARAASVAAVKEARERCATPALKYRISQKAMIRAMQLHGPDHVRDPNFIKEQAEAYPEIVADPKIREDIGAVARRVWGSRVKTFRACDCGKGTFSGLRDMLASAARGEPLGLHVVIR